MALHPPADARRHRGVSISFDASELEWVDALVDTLEHARYPLAARSEVVRIALLGLRSVLTDKSPSEILQYFAQKHGDHFVSAVMATKPPAPVDPPTEGSK